MKKAIGLDLGTTTLGLAVSDSLGLVHPRPVFEFPKKAYRRAIGRFLELVEETGIREAALGYPLNMDGSEGEAALRSRRFKEIVEREHPDISVHLVDERLSTVEAYEEMNERGVKSRRKKGLVDSEAACIILERHLAKERENAGNQGQ